MSIFANEALIYICYMAIQLNTKPSDKDLRGKSHWWGAPDLPEDMACPYVLINEGTDDEYAEPLTFVCQIRCDEIAEYDKEGLLPHEGMLYFFAPLDYFLGEDDSPLDQFTKPVVIYNNSTVGLVPYEINWEDTGESIFRAAEEIIFSEQQDKSDGILMLGRPYQDEVDMQHEDDICLMQIDEDDRWGLRFYDCGMYFFFIPRKSLKKGTWEDVEGELFFY